MQPHERKLYLYDVLARQPMTEIPMKIIRNSKAALNEKFGTHKKNMDRIRECLKSLRKLGWIDIEYKKIRVFSTKKNKWVETVLIEKVKVLPKKEIDKKK